VTLMNGTRYEITDQDIFRFRTWLKRYTPDSEVGRACMPSLCPIANWIASELGWDQHDEGMIMVSGERIEIEGQHINPPWWIRGFVPRIDKHRSCMDYVMAAECIWVVDDLIRELRIEEGV
jgi:hypothetical protein